MTIKKNIQNKENFVLRKDALNPEEILGDLSSVEQMAFIWAKYRENLKTIEFSLLLDFCKLRKFSREELDSFREGLEAMNIFIEKCFMAIKQKNEEK